MLILSQTVNGCDKVAEWVFKEFDKNWNIGRYKIENTFVNSATGNPLYTNSIYYYLDFTYAIDDPVISKFNVHTDQNYGMQYNGQYSFHRFDYVGNNAAGENTFFKKDTFDFFIQIWFYSCKTTDFVILSLQESEVVDDYGADSAPYLTIGVDGNGYYYYELRTIDNEINIFSVNPTQLQPKEGFNYIAFGVNEVYEMSYVTLYNRHETGPGTRNAWNDYEWLVANPAATVNTGKHFQVITGYYDETENVGGPTKTTLVIGCKTHRATLQNTQDNDQAYGLCMQGWISYISIYADDTRTGTCTGATENSEAGAEAFSDAAGTFRNTALYAIDNTVKDFNTLHFSDNIVFLWDSLIATSTPTFQQEAINIGTYSSDFSCLLQISDTGRDYSPYYIESQGRMTGNDTEYFICTLTPADLTTRVSFFGTMFTFEAWFRLDPFDIQYDGYVADLACLYHISDEICRIGIGVSNKFIRVYVNDQRLDIPQDFLLQRDGWVVLGASYRRVHEYETWVDVFFNGIKIHSAQFLTWWSYDYVSASEKSYRIVVSRDVPGIVRTVRIYNQAFCKTDEPMPVETDSSKCNIISGTEQCQRCDKYQETGGVNSGVGTYSCYSTCEDYRHYLSSDGTCNDCSNSCRYCDDFKGNLFDLKGVNHCFRCNSTQNFIYNEDKGIQRKDSNDGDLRSCRCGSGSYPFEGECKPCDVRCQVCNHMFNFDCQSCSEVGYMTQPGVCNYDCPPGMIPNNITRTCDQAEVKDIQLFQKPIDPQGCYEGFYYNWDRDRCMKCHDNCLTCEFKDDRCTTCHKSSWLDVSKRCNEAELERQSYKPAVYKGRTSKLAYEICGDGKNYGVLVCDDGNNESGDGCSSQCTVEEGYYCYGGYSDQRRDWCDYIRTELETVMVDSNNGLMLRFTRPVKFRQDISNDFFEQLQWFANDIQLSMGPRNQENNTFEINPEIQFFDLPCSYLYIRTDITETIFGYPREDNVMNVMFLAQTGLLVDENDIPVKGLTKPFKAVMYPYEYYPNGYYEEPREWGQRTLMVIVSLITLWSLTFWIFTGTATPLLLVLMGLQMVFFTGCQDYFLDDRLAYFWRFFNVFKLEHVRVQNVFINQRWIDLEQVSRALNNPNLNNIAEYYYNNFYLNNYFKMYVWIAFFIIGPIIALVDFLFSTFVAQPKRISFRNQWRDQVLSRYFFSSALSLMNLTFYPFMLTALLEIRGWSVSNSYEVQSFVFSWLVMLGQVLFLITMWAIPMMHTYRHDHPLFRFRFRMFYWPFKPYFWSMLFTPLYATRRFIHCAFVAFFQTIAFVPAGLQLLLTFTFISYLIIVRPFRSKICTFTALMMEITNFMIQLFFLPFNTDRETQQKSNARTTIFRFQFAVLLPVLVIFSIMVWWRSLDYFYYRRWGVRRDTWVHRLEARFSEKLNYRGQQINRQLISLFDMVKLHRTGNHRALNNLQRESARKDAKPEEIFPLEETPREVKQLKEQKEDFNKIENLEVRTHRSLDLTKQRGHENEKQNPNAIKKKYKDLEEFDDVLFRRDPYKDGFPEKYSNNKYYRKKLIPIKKPD